MALFLFWLETPPSEFDPSDPIIRGSKEETDKYILGIIEQNDRKTLQLNE